MNIEGIALLELPEPLLLLITSAFFLSPTSLHLVILPLLWILGGPLVVLATSLALLAAVAGPTVTFLFDAGRVTKSLAIYARPHIALSTHLSAQHALRRHFLGFPKVGGHFFGFWPGKNFFLGQLVTRVLDFDDFFFRGMLGY